MFGDPVFRGPVWKTYFAQELFRIFRICQNVLEIGSGALFLCRLSSFNTAVLPHKAIPGTNVCNGINLTSYPCIYIPH